MGQILEKIKGKEWKETQIRMITDKIFDHIKNDNGRANLTFEDLYIAVLLVYNDINKRLSGPHLNPPTKDQVRDLMQESDINLDGELDREEFVKFILQMTRNTLITVSQGLMITVAAAPTLALITRKSMENVPGFGKVVKKVPNSIFASIVTLFVVGLQQRAERTSSSS